MVSSGDWSSSENGVPKAAERPYRTIASVISPSRTNALFTSGRDTSTCFRIAADVIGPQYPSGVAPTAHWISFTAVIPWDRYMSVRPEFTTNQIALPGTPERKVDDPP